MMTSDAVSPITFRRLLTRSVMVPPALLGVLALAFLGQIMYLLSAAQWVDHSNQAIAKANALLKLLVDGETGLRGYQITGEPAFLEPYLVEERGVGAAFEDLIELVSDDRPQVERLRALRTDHAGWQDYARNMIDLRREGGDYQTPARNGEGKRRMDGMRGQIADFILVEEELRDTRARTARQATWVVVGVSLGLALLLGGVLAFSTRRQLLRVSATYLKALSEIQAQAESLRRSAHRLETLHEIDRATLAGESVPGMAHSALCRTEQIVPAGTAFVVAFDLGDGPVHVISRSDPGMPFGVVDLTLASAGPLEFSEKGGLQAITDLGEVAERSPLQDRLFRSGQRSCVVVPLRADGRQFGVLVLADPRPSAFSSEHQQVADEVAQQLAVAFQQARLREDSQRHAEELERRVNDRTHELQEALASVKQLQGLIPICAWCKKIRDDKSYWHVVEHYVAAHSEARFTHGICPDCLEKNLGTLHGETS